MPLLDLHLRPHQPNSTINFPTSQLHQEDAVIETPLSVRTTIQGLALNEQT